MAIVLRIADQFRTLAELVGVLMLRPVVLCLSLPSRRLRDGFVVAPPCVAGGDRPKQPRPGGTRRWHGHAPGGSGRQAGDGGRDAVAADAGAVRVRADPPARPGLSGVRLLCAAR